MPDSNAVYIDTSVLVKWLVIENYTKAVVAFFNQDSPLILSELVLLELDCALRRMERSGAISQTYRLQAEATLGQQLQEQWFQLTPISMQVFKEAKLLIESITPMSLRSLDAMHLTIAKKANLKRLATADREMLLAAQQLNFRTEYFND
ncbi:MAG: type II toxin-antitoxin system VapC family toxin [Methylophilaceae bacterium]